MWNLWRNLSTAGLDKDHSILGIGSAVDDSFYFPLFVGVLCLYTR